MMLSTKSSRKRNSIPKDEPSKVLLVCIYDTVALDITNDIVYEKFKPFGAIVKLLIFEKSEVTKLFIEYAEIQQAENVRKPSFRLNLSSRGASFMETFAK